MISVFRKEPDSMPGSMPRYFRSRVWLPIMAAFIIALLIIFYAITMVNMNAIKKTVDDLNKGPYAATVAAGEVETMLAKLRTLSVSFEYVQTPETMSAVEESYREIDRKIGEPLSVIEGVYPSSPNKAEALRAAYDQLVAEQQNLIDMCRSPSFREEDAEKYVAVHIDPLVANMLVMNTSIIDDARQSFTSLSDLANKMKDETLLYASILMIAVLAELIVFFYFIRRRNNQRRQLQKSLEAALESARRANQAKTQFLANMSHDIRTPCSAIVGLTEIAERHQDSPERVQECLTKIALSSHHLIRLINDVLDMSKIENGQVLASEETFVPDDLIVFVSTVVQLQAKTKGLFFETKQEGIHGLRLRGDILHVKQILLNLVGNAVKFTAPGGWVVLRVQRIQKQNKVFHDSFDEVVWLRFEIEDNGIGMTPEFLEHIFDPFERDREGEARNIEGTGLGTSIAKGFVDQMGGTIEVQSERHKGTKFTVDLPFGLEMIADVVSAQDHSGAPAENFAGAKVLLAEDNDINAEIACEIIGRTGAEVFRVCDGVEAVEAVLSAAPSTYDMVFMDIQMPRMDGLVAAKTLTETCEQEGRVRPPIVAMTANAYAEDRRRAREAGMDGYLVKPIDFLEICRQLEKFVPDRSATDETQ